MIEREKGSLFDSSQEKQTLTVLEALLRKDEQMQQWLYAADSENEELKRKVAEQETVISELRAENANLMERCRWSDEAYNTIKNAFFWKITKPLRWILDGVKVMFRKSKAMHLIWKGLKSLKNDGVRCTWWRVQQKIKNRGTDDKKIEFDLSAIQNVEELKGEYIPDMRLYTETVDLILPVFNGWRILPPLLESIPRTGMKYRLIIVDDKSTDSRILPMLCDYAEKHANTVVIENEVNMGYTKSINKALALTKGHVVLLNSDIRLPSNWLERLIAPIITEQNVASATPFTNSGTVCSFPNFCENNKLFLGLTVDKIDAAFSKIVPKYITMPTGVGFCMALSREAIDKVGNYDEENFPIGYGEENDWCQRAIKKGFSNVLVENLFVYHQHGATFEPEQKRRLIEQNSKTLLRKHRDYDRDVAVFCQKDPARCIREAVKISLLNSMASKQTVLAFDHAWGGGATSYLNGKTEDVTDAGGMFITVRYHENRGEYSVKYCYQEYDCTFTAKKIESILNVLPESIDEIWVNELVSYPGLFMLQRKIIDFARERKAKLIFRLHDFFCICPRITLLDEHEKFCGVKSAEECDRCSCANANMEQWRGEWEDFLLDCDEITAFSNDSIQHLLRAYPTVQDRVKLIPHQPKPLDKVTVVSDRRYLTIGLLGGISMEKGLHIVQEMCKLIDRKRLPICIKLIGYASEPMHMYKCFSQTGRYQKEDLPDLMEENKVDIVFISSVWPETFSYTASEAMSMGLPVACFDLGAPAERVRMYQKGLVIKKVDAREALQGIVKYIGK